jgi:TPR repeat protein
MVEQKHFRSDEPDNGSYDQDFDSPRPYSFGRSAFNGFDSGESVPLFLSDPDGEPDPGEYANPLRRHRRASISMRILMGTVAASAVAVLFAWFTSDATRDVLISAKASISTILPIPSAAAQPEVAAPPEAPAQLAAHDNQLKDPARWSAPGATDVQANARAASAPVAIAPPADAQSGPVIAMAPTREVISSAYQNALQSRTAAPAAAVAATPPGAAAPQADTPPARHLDPDEVALLMKRAKDLLSTGDIPAARLLLRRAADAQEPLAALMLAQSYDPDMLGTQDVRNINPDLAMARSWYAKAAQLGSADAQRRLAQMQN